MTTWKGWHRVFSGILICLIYSNNICGQIFSGRTPGPAPPADSGYFKVYYDELGEICEPENAYYYLMNPTNLGQKYKQIRGFYMNHIPHSIMAYTEDSVTRLVIDYYPSGAKKAQYFLSPEGPTGPYTNWLDDDSNSVQEEGRYISDGRMVTKYHKNKSGVVTVSNGTGFIKEFYENGRLKTEYKIEAGQAHGPVKYYWASGDLKSEGTFNKGFHSGEWVGYNYNGAIIYREFYSSLGILEKGISYYNGEEIEYFESYSDNSNFIESKYINPKLRREIYDLVRRTWNNGGGASIQVGRNKQGEVYLMKVLYESVEGLGELVFKEYKNGTKQSITLKRGIPIESWSIYWYNLTF